jgi:hypothetical protein
MFRTFQNKYWLTAISSYALVYAILVLPRIIARWAPKSQPAGAVFATLAIFNLVGVVHVLLFFFTQNGLFFLQYNDTQTISTKSAPSLLELGSLGDDRESARNEDEDGVGIDNIGSSLLKVL